MNLQNGELKNDRSKILSDHQTVALYIPSADA